MSDRHQIVGIAAQAAGKSITEAIGEPVFVMIEAAITHPRFR
jgi:hypothetical protein